MHALVGVCYLGRNKQLHICSPGSPLALTNLALLAYQALLGTHVVPHDTVISYQCDRSISPSIGKETKKLTKSANDWCSVHSYGSASPLQPPDLKVRGLLGAVPDPPLRLFFPHELHRRLVRQS